VHRIAQKPKRIVRVTTKLHFTSKISVNTRWMHLQTGQPKYRLDRSRVCRGRPRLPIIPAVPTWSTTSHSWSSTESGSLSNQR